MRGINLALVVPRIKGNYYKPSIYQGYKWCDSADSTTITMIKLRSDWQSRKTPLRARYGVSSWFIPRKMAAIYRKRTVIHIMTSSQLPVRGRQATCFAPRWLLVIYQSHRECWWTDSGGRYPWRHHHRRPPRQWSLAPGPSVRRCSHTSGCRSSGNPWRAKSKTVRRLQTIMTS